MRIDTEKVIQAISIIPLMQFTGVDTGERMISDHFNQTIEQ